MKNVVVAIILGSIVVSCSSVKRNNNKLTEKRSPSELHADVDYLNHKLQTNHPLLYLYIDKKALDYKFDSVKATIIEPLTSREFYYRIAPVVATIKQGHARLFQSTRGFTSKESKALKISNFGKSPLAKMKFGVFDDRLYILKNDSWNKSVVPGTEVVSINGIDAKALLDKYRTTFTSDGFNPTFKNRVLSMRFPNFLYSDFDFSDSLTCSFRVGDSLSKVVLHRRSPIDTARHDSLKVVLKRVLTAQQKDSVKSEKRKRSYLGYEAEEKRYSKTLTFLEPDSSIAIIRIADFSLGRYAKFYRNSFKTLDSLKTGTLIIDLRNNLGGRANEIKELYSYLADTNFVFVDKSEITSPQSILYTAYFQSSSVVSKILTLPFYPIYLGVALAHLSKDKDGKYYYRLGIAKQSKPKANRYKGKVYVVINGGSFSASCTISSNLKGSKRALFVGEETGGTYNGTVAGLMPTFTLPNSKLKAKFGLLSVDPHYKTDVVGRGIFPDVAISPTLDDFLQGNDPELNWIVEKVRSEKAAKTVAQE